MMSKPRKWFTAVIIMVLTMIAFADLAGYGPLCYAEEKVSSEELLDRYSAGAAADFEKSTTPTEEEVLAKRQRKQELLKPGNLVMSDVNDSLNVRSEPDAASEKVGKLYKDCAGYILEYGDEWTKIESGKVVGWVSNRYLLFGDDAKQLAGEVGYYRAKVATETLRVRKEPSVDAGVYGLIASEEVYDVVQRTEDWLVIDFEGAKGYINEDYVDIDFHLDYGETVEEIAAREAAEEAKRKAAEEAARKKKQKLVKKNYGSYSATASDVELLGALIQCEAGNQPYEGKVAVGAVVMNRVRSKAYPNTIYGVIYAKGQFSPAGSGLVDKRLAKGVSASCIKAAEEALSGYSNVGGATSFRPVGKHDGIIIGGHVFW